MSEEIEQVTVTIVGADRANVATILECAADAIEGEAKLVRSKGRQLAAASLLDDRSARMRRYARIIR